MRTKQAVVAVALTLAAFTAHGEIEGVKKAMPTESAPMGSVLQGITLQPLTTAEEEEARGKGLFLAVFKGVWKTFTWVQCGQYALACKAY